MNGQKTTSSDCQSLLSRCQSLSKLTFLTLFSKITLATNHHLLAKYLQKSKVRFSSNLLFKISKTKIHLLARYYPHRLCSATSAWRCGHRTIRFYQRRLISYSSRLFVAAFDKTLKIIGKEAPDVALNFLSVFLWDHIEDNFGCQLGCLAITIIRGWHFGHITTDQFLAFDNVV